MRKLLEVTIDDQGNLDIKSDNEQFLDEIISPYNPKIANAFFKRVLAVMINRIWERRNTGISKVVRLLSMAEICATAEPYGQIEELWTNMMFSFIPRYEKYTDSLKQKYGYDPSSKQRPLTMGDLSCFGPFKLKPLNNRRKGNRRKK